MAFTVTLILIYVFILNIFYSKYVFYKYIYHFWMERQLSLMIMGTRAYCIFILFTLKLF